MATTNPVFQVLTTGSSDQASGLAMMAKGLKIDDATTPLKPGQLAAINFHTGLTVDATSTQEELQDIVFAVGINRSTGQDSTKALEDVMYSAGQVIQKRSIKGATLKPYMAEVAKVVEVSGCSALCDTDYSLKITFMNGDIYALFGYNLLSKTYSYRTSCCPMTACDECDNVGSSAELAGGLANAINADPDKLVTASVYTFKMSGTISNAAAGTATVTVGSTTYSNISVPGTAAGGATAIAAAINAQAGSPYRASVSAVPAANTLNVYPVNSGVASADTLAVTGNASIAANPAGSLTATKSTTGLTTAEIAALATAGAGASLRITGNPSTRANLNGNINMKYTKAGLNFNVSLTNGLSPCNCTSTVITYPRYAEGSGYDLKELEYTAGGWNGKPGPYRVLNGLGMQKDDYEFFISSAKTYTIFVLDYDQFSVGGWLEYRNNLRTIIAVPSTDTATVTSLMTFIDAAYAGAIKLADDATALIGTGAGGTNKPIYSDPASGITALTDGIESLS